MKSSIAALAVVVISLAAATSSAAEARPNIVLFLVDDMGWIDSTPYGSQYYETPNMERLAAQAMRFTDAYAVPLCSPTRASILTGQYSARHRVTSATGHLLAAPAEASPYPAQAAPNRPLIYANSQNYLDPRLVTLAEVLRRAGYRTGHFGKWHLGVSREHWPEEQGFEVAWHCAPDPGPPSYFSPYGVVAEGEGAGRRKVGNITDGPAGEYITDRLTDEALKFIEQHRGEPFYLNLWQYGVHGPWGHKPAYTAEFAKKDDPRGQQRNPIMASMLRSVDESLGRVLDKLDELRLTDNTIFIFYSDNGGNVHSNVPGEASTEQAARNRNAMLEDWRKWAGNEPPTNNAPLREGKGRIYEGGQRVPLMIRWPGHIAPGTTTEAVVGPIDLYPTVLDALNLPAPQGHMIDGESILPVLMQTGQLGREAYFTWFPHLIPAVSVRHGDWKLIRRFEPHPNYPEVRELYNLRADIGETRNLAAEEPERVRRLDALIDDFIRDTGALAPRSNPAYAAGNAPADPADGLVARLCEMTLVPGALRVTGTGKSPFLGTARVRHAGPLTLHLRLRCAVAGTGRVEWKTAEQETFENAGQRVTFEVSAGTDWHDLQIKLPIQERAAIIRLYLPADAAPVELQSIRYLATDSGRVVHAWEFGSR